MYSPLESLIGHYRGKKDIGNSLAAAAITGALFKSTGEIVPHYSFSVYDISLQLTSMYTWMKVASNIVPECSLSLYSYCSVQGKCPWVLKHNA